jgi:hypothetical protein
MKHSIIIIIDEIIFPKLFIQPLHLEMNNDVHIEICNSFDEIGYKLVSLNCELILLHGGVETCIEIIRH